MQAHTIDLTATRSGRARRRLAVGALAVVASTASPLAEVRAADCAGARRLPDADHPARAAAAALCLVNRERSRRDLPRLTAHAGLARAGRRYARLMVRARFFSHTSPAGASMADRLRAVGYAREDREWMIGEALAWGVGNRATPAATVAAWLGSRPHRRLLLDPRYRDAGVGATTGVPVTDAAPGPGATYALELGVRP